MSTTELFRRIDISRTTSYGHYRACILYRGKNYHCTTTNSQAFDAYNNPDTKGFYTQRKALLALWNECKTKNQLP